MKGEDGQGGLMREDSTSLGRFITLAMKAVTTRESYVDVSASSSRVNSLLRAGHIELAAGDIP
jgi:hypothetical protein